MQILHTVSDIRHCIKNWRNAGQRIAFVPTMGNLHAGHLQLVQEAKHHADKVIVSIFVNPTQFGVNEDFADYPRTETADCEKLAAESCDVVFLPTVEMIYAPNAQTTVSVSDVSKNYCGSSRAGHFDGVATVVCKLFNIVQPDISLFGLKDFQQFVVILTLVRDLHLPIELIGVPTVRELDGLAMSSRNGYLNSVARETAPKLYQTLQQARDELIAGQAITVVEQHAITKLTQAGFIVDYFKVAKRSDLQFATLDDNALIILVAAKLDTTRLIDNLWVDK